ncbi:UDP-N-acetylglucosamine 2-epimerase [Aquitalea sp. FJL05]|uniref:UDP-N-acetylglucosamine 2-epimerase n=1 Tax=Aquitalea sp. FJL05 TaxID=2153366 RepID=UPI001F22278E|nr:UDP-N-acetylglucosamine 2-epimerase [Aquitalea sp. FJL05]
MASLKMRNGWLIALSTFPAASRNPFMSNRKICIVTGSRAEYGLLRWLATDLRADPDVHLQFLVTGMHLAHEYGFTIKEIHADGFHVDETIESQLASDSNIGMVKSMGLGMIGCADAFRRLQPDVVVLLGDRYEILAAAQASALMGIPVAHISGGEVTEGAVDDWIRHAITKCAWWHFAATEQYCQRIIQLGETPDRVFNTGDPGLDSISRLSLLTREQLEAEIGLSLQDPLFMVTYHPATLGDESPALSFGKVLNALDRFPQATVIMTKPNADAGGRELADMAERWVQKNQHRARCFVSMGQLRYLSTMRLANVVIGNSSSGIVEAPAAKVATVNIGPRQDGRLKASSIMDCPDDESAIVATINLALSETTRAALPATVSLYGECGASERMKHLLTSLPLPARIKKKFHDI